MASLFGIRLAMMNCPLQIFETNVTVGGVDSKKKARVERRPPGGSRMSKSEESLKCVERNGQIKDAVPTLKRQKGKKEKKKK